MLSNSLSFLFDSLARIAVFLSLVASHSQFFLIDLLACFAIFFISSVVSHSQYLLTYNMLSLSFSVAFLSLYSIIRSLFHCFKNFSLSPFCSIFSLAMMDIQKIAESGVSKLWVPMTKSFLSRVRKIFCALPRYEHTAL